MKRQRIGQSEFEESKNRRIEETKKLKSVGKNSFQTVQ